MPRRARMYVPGLPYHVVQRGNNREACFFAIDDYQYYLTLLTDLLPKYGVALHAFVLMTNHVHFLMTPYESDSISRLSKVVGSRYAQYINRTYKRSGTLWEGRHKSSAVDTELYLLKCYRYIELNPVAAMMVSRPDEYRWSSFDVNAWGGASAIITPHEEYRKLGACNAERQEAYRQLFRTCLAEEDVQSIRKSAHYCQPLGSDRFRLQIETKSGVKLGQLGRGRPKGLVKK